MVGADAIKKTPGHFMAPWCFFVFSRKGSLLSFVLFVSFVFDFPTAT
jgi:hypothetical protein